MFFDNKASIYLCLLAFIFGLLLTGYFSFSQGFYLGLFSFIFLFITGVVLKNKRFLIIDLRYIFIIFLVFITGFYYYYFRLPSVSDLDISHYISHSFYNRVAVEGVILTTPRVNQNHKSRFIFQARELVKENNEREKVTGKIYVTSPLLEVNGLFPSTVVILEGNLYQPSPPLNPDGFNFADYLQRQGVFSGLRVNSVSVIKEGNRWNEFLFWIRRRIIQTHVRFLNIPSGSLVSSMVMGSRAVDLDWQLQESFRLAGLAHVLAASGFHVSLLLGLILAVTQSFSSRTRFLMGGLTLFIYATITGFYPSILRACLMGFAILAAIINEKKVRVSGSLLLVAVILLLINPLWIFDLGFQLSFLATFGLIVSLPTIVQKLDWLPPTLANLIAVPLAATLWTLPLQFYYFHRFPLYGILTNILSTPLVIILTLGGIFTAFIGVFFPLLGSAIASIFYPIIWLLIKLVKISNQLPLSSIAVGQINIFTLIIIYVIFLVILYIKSVNKYKYFLIIFTLILIIFPLIYQKLTLIQITVIDNSYKPTIIIQNKSNTALINLGDKDNIYFTILPFLRSEGINSVELVIDNKNKESLNILTKYLPVKNINQFHQNTIKSIKIKEINPSYIYFTLENNSFLIIKKQVDNLTKYNNFDYIIVMANNINYDFLENINFHSILSKNTELKTNLENTKVSLINNNFIQWQLTKNDRS
ncbi:ComEC/Rec2 family competence protein [Cyanobacterium aponinum UTEX 3221]|uniref:ComEC/Rec2 family competence protein n=1 Tax=Cyanobacterium aponinum TaxID=379064 RepID=UPI000C12D9D7|nr:ComEC/Rec2 family competence protein [Cyanobacterium aponinum]PHV61664.1 competence protein ComEC [Cyanobacterium aponinum IPPAS B-1201]WRL39840.1 ComEC/Rec2 family competence protein [Cyanobacterium aponinum UTEX 3221]